VHYAVNVQRKSLVSAAPFADKFYLEKQKLVPKGLADLLTKYSERQS
jgi:hypothetical protein